MHRQAGAERVSLHRPEENAFPWKPMAFIRQLCVLLERGGEADGFTYPVHFFPGIFGRGLPESNTGTDGGWSYAQLLPEHDIDFIRRIALPGFQRFHSFHQPGIKFSA